MKKIILSIIVLFSAVSLFAAEDTVFYVAKYKSLSQLVAAVNANGGGVIEFPEGKEYLVSVKEDSNGGYVFDPQDFAVVMNFKHCKKVIVNFNGSTLRLKPNHSTKYSLMRFYDCQYFQVNDGILIGDARTHDYSSVVYNGQRMDSSHEWGHGIMVTGSRGKISRMKVSEMIGDGIYLGSCKIGDRVCHTAAVVDSSEVSVCRRNGVTIASNIGVALRYCKISKVGTSEGVVGTAPQAGIDIEYEDGVFDVGDILLDGCEISECTSNTVTSSNSFPQKPRSLTVANSSFSDSYFQIANVDTQKLVYGCSFYHVPIQMAVANVKSCSFVWGSDLNYVNGGQFDSCSFVGTVDNVQGPYGCCITGTNMSPAIFNNCTFKDIRGANNDSYEFQGFSGSYFPLYVEFNNCLIDNCTFNKGGGTYDSIMTFMSSVLKNGCKFFHLGGSRIVFQSSTLDKVDGPLERSDLFRFRRCKVNE